MRAEIGVGAGDAAGVVYDDQGRQIGRVTSALIQSMPPVLESNALPMLLVAGSTQQAHFWAREMGFETKQSWPYLSTNPWCRWFVPGVPPYPDWRRCKEAFFVGTWERLPVLDVARLVADLEYMTIPTTYVCDPAGQVIERHAEWCRWITKSRRKLSSWHIFREDRDPTEAVYATLCGLQETVAFLCQTPRFETLRRYGAPRGACGICAHELGKFAPADARGNLDRMPASMARVGLAADGAARASRRLNDALR